MAIKRVAQRVKQGGHHIDKDVIIRRYRKGVKNFFNYYFPLADIALIIDNSLEKFRLIARKTRSGNLDVKDNSTWQKIKSIK
ncbi:MAG: hypothetical protein Tsb0015_10790 [Simkaniaceae bacterium]